jgi:leucyl aminopeptidase (aminopeptidase T)
MTADFLELRKLAERLRDRLARGKIAHVTSPAGTDVRMVIEGRKPVGWLTGVCRNRGEVSAFPGGEVSLPPLECTTEGRIVIEHIMTESRPGAAMTWVVEKGEAYASRAARPWRWAHIRGSECAQHRQLGIINPCRA